MAGTRGLTPEDRRAIEQLKVDILLGNEEPPDEDTIIVAFQTSEGWLDADGEPIPKGADVAFGKPGFLKERTEAEREGYQILDEDPDSGEHDLEDPVLVPWDYGDRPLPGEEGGD